MTIRAEYAKYQQAGGTLTEDAYAAHLDALRTQIGALISEDPTDRASDIGRRIFDHLDLPTAVAFSRVSRGVHQRAQSRWFVTRVDEIVLKYVKRDGVSYLDYTKSVGWIDWLVTAFQTAGVATSIAAGVKSAQHNNRVPANAPKKTIIWSDEDGTYKRTIVDHPEAAKARTWTAAAILVGVPTGVSIFCKGLRCAFNDIDLEAFFSDVEREIFGQETAPWYAKIISPGFHRWRLEKMKERLAADPANWQDHPVLAEMICPLSNSFMLFPVRDACGHYFDWRALRAYQLHPRTENPLECPINQQKPNTGLVGAQFDKARFDQIQGML